MMGQLIIVGQNGTKQEFSVDEVKVTVTRTSVHVSATGPSIVDETHEEKNIKQIVINL